jgi:endonuclease/exonuclease/phosphatase (EEP) superfamily protein YafD
MQTAHWSSFGCGHLALFCFIARPRTRMPIFGASRLRHGARIVRYCAAAGANQLVMRWQPTSTRTGLQQQQQQQLLLACRMRRNHRQLLL